MMKFVVFTTDLALAPIDGRNPPGGKLYEFHSIEEARQFAEKEKDNWDRVVIYERLEPGNLDGIEHYQKGDRYIGNRRVKNR